ncbi:MAG TPA: VWA domain-containing protein [Blastocatellia bacterium]|nr:VWA domain-containing protein [Blastocatellia bacterium]
MNRFMYPQSLWTRTALAVLTLFAAALPVFGQGQEEKPQQDSQQPSIKIGTNLVTVPVIVTDRYGRFVTGLTRNEFTVREEGAPHRIEDFSSTEAPFSVALLIDTSRSTQNKLGKIRKAAETFIKQLLPNDRIMVVSFDEKVRFICDFTSNHAELERAVKSLKSSYMTSLYDAIHLTINEKMNKIQGRKAIVVLTDGVDTASKQATYESAIELAASAGIITYAVQYETRNDGASKPVYIPGIGSKFAPRSGLKWQDTQQQKPKPESEESKSESEEKSNTSQPKEGAPTSTPGAPPSSRVNSQRQQPIRDRYLIATDFLRTLAAQSGGLPFRAETIESTSYAFQLIANELHNQYTLTYISTNERRDGNYRTIAVGVNNSDLVVRARRFYRAPKDEAPGAEQDKKIDPKPGQ